MRRLLGIFMILGGFWAFFWLGGAAYSPKDLLDLRLVFSGQETPGKIRGRARVLDGDTLDIGGQRVRISGIDAPEQDQPCTAPSGLTWRCGDVARAALGRLLMGKTVTCSGTTRDRYGRLIASCTVEGRDAGRWMVEHGWAMAYRRYSPAYVADEVRAREGHRGVWIGTMQPPWDWRAAQR